METTQDQKDDLAGVVMERYRRAKEYRESHIVHQGKSFETLIGWDDLHPDHHALWVHPGNGELLINGNDGGANVSFTGAESWTSPQLRPPSFSVFRPARTSGEASGRMPSSARCSRGVPSASATGIGTISRAKAPAPVAAAARRWLSTA